MTYEEQLLAAFDEEMQGQQLLIMATLTNAQRLVDKASGIDKIGLKSRLQKIFEKRLEALLEVNNV